MTFLGITINDEFHKAPQLRPPRRPTKNYTDARLAFSHSSDIIKTRLQFDCILPVAKKWSVTDNRSSAVIGRLNGVS